MINVSKMTVPLLRCNKQGQSQWQQHLTTCSLRWLQKTASNDRDMKWCGKLFQMQAPVTATVETTAAVTVSDLRPH